MSFYYSYIPVRGISVPVYLQYDHGVSSYLATPADKMLGVRWPYGVASIHNLVDRQKYDVTVEMDVPRSETNLQAGNWMVELEMRAPPSTGGGVMSMLGWDEDEDVKDSKDGNTPAGEDGAEFLARRPSTLVKSKRPALLTYRSPLIELSYRLLRLPMYLIGWHTESERIEVSMLESVVFEQGSRNIPSSVRLEIRSRQPLEVYHVKVHISARLEGLRWLMYRYWMTSAVVATTLFWAVEMGVLVFTWAAITLIFGSSSTSADYEGGHKIKSDPEFTTTKFETGETEPGTPFSDTSRTFPTLPSLQPLSYTSPKEEQATPNLEDIPLKEEAEADDEEDDFILEEPIPLRAEREGIFTDSGIGTSLESSVERNLARRRSGKLKDDAGD